VAVSKKKLPGSAITDFFAKKDQPASAAKKPTQRNITGDVAVFNDIQQVDLDGDGEKELVAVFSTSINSSGVKVIKIGKKGNGIIIFKHIFPTPNTKLIVKNNECIIIAEDFDLDKEYLVKKIYRWDGNTFISGNTKLIYGLAAFAKPAKVDILFR
jgi:hypothetical protein